MIHTHALEPRRLFANTGLDTAFGSAGAATLVAGDEVKAVLPTATGIYVDVWSYGQPARRYVRKFTTAGRLDTTWGDNGSQRVPAGTPNYGVNAGGQLAHDAATGKLYVAGGTTTGGGISVERLTAAGQPDATFGRGGIVTEVATDDGDEFSSDVRQFNGMTPLSGGRLLVSFQSVFNPDFYGSFTTRSDFKLWRLTNKGVGDTTFGSNGQVTIMRGGGDNHVSDHGDYSRTSTSRFADMQIYPDGGVRVVSLLVNQISSGSYGFGNDTETLSQSQYVQSQIVTNDGAVQSPTVIPLARDAYSDAPAKRQVAFRAVLVKADGRYARVIGGRGTAAPVTAVPKLAASALTVTTIKPNGRAYTTALNVADGGTLTAIASGSARTAVFSGTRLTVLNSDATRAAFGKAGSVVVNAGLTAAAIDGSGRVLAADGATLARFDGD